MYFFGCTHEMWKFQVWDQPCPRAATCARAAVPTPSAPYLSELIQSHLFFVFIYFFFLAAPRHMELPGQGPERSEPRVQPQLQLQQHQILNHCAQLGIEPVSQRSPDTSDPLCRSRNSYCNQKTKLYWEQNCLSPSPRKTRLPPFL